jgi:hypothetical protein
MSIVWEVAELSLTGVLSLLLMPSLRQSIYVTHVKLLARVRLWSCFSLSLEKDLLPKDSRLSNAWCLVSHGPGACAELGDSGRTACIFVEFLIGSLVSHLSLLSLLPAWRGRVLPKHVRDFFWRYGLFGRDANRPA